MKKALEEFENGNAKSVIILADADTEAPWFQNLAYASSAVLFCSSYIKYLAWDGQQKSRLKGQAVIYLGSDPNRFIDKFDMFGFCVQVVK